MGSLAEKGLANSGMERIRLRSAQAPAGPGGQAQADTDSGWLKLGLTGYRFGSNSGRLNQARKNVARARGPGPTQFRDDSKEVSDSGTGGLNPARAQAARSTS